MGGKCAGPWDARNRPEHERCRMMEEKGKTRERVFDLLLGPPPCFLQGHQLVTTPSSILTMALQLLAQYNTFGLIEGGDRKLGKMCTTHHTQHSCHRITHRKTPCLERENYNLLYTSSSRPCRGSCARRLKRVPRSSAMRDDWMYSSPPASGASKENQTKRRRRKPTASKPFAKLGSLIVSVALCGEMAG